MCPLLKNIPGIPLLLRMMVLITLLGGVIFSVTPLIPGVGFNLYGKSLSWLELWQTGVVVAIFTNGLLFFGIAYAILKQRIWARPILVFFPPLHFAPFWMAHLVFGGLDPPQPLHRFAMYCAIWAIISGTYLYSSRTVRSYFNKNQVGP